MVLEPISPELVLVADEEEARRARQQLPELPWEVFRPRAPEPPAAVVQHVATPPPRRRRRVAAGALVLVAIGVAGYLTQTQWSAGRTRPTLETRASYTVPADTVPADTVPAEPTTRAQEPATTALPTTTTAPTATVAAPPPKPEPAFVPARAWAWAPRAGARAYAVTFYLDGRVVLRAQPTDALFQLPHSFRYRRGTYRWTVETVPATAGPPIIDSTFVVTSATAANAHR